VPALVIEVGDSVWWPSRLAKEAARADARERAAPPPEPSAQP
jgi:hypothetical protein